MPNMIHLMRRLLFLETSQRPQQFRVRILIFIHWRRGRTQVSALPSHVVMSCHQIVLDDRKGLPASRRFTTITSADG